MRNRALTWKNNLMTKKEKERKEIPVVSTRKANWTRYSIFAFHIILKCIETECELLSLLTHFPQNQMITAISCSLCRWPACICCTATEWSLEPKCTEQTWLLLQLADNWQAAHNPCSLQLTARLLKNIHNGRMVWTALRKDQASVGYCCSKHSQKDELTSLSFIAVRMGFPVCSSPSTGKEAAPQLLLGQHCKAWFSSFALQPYRHSYTCQICSCCSQTTYNLLFAPKWLISLFKIEVYGIEDVKYMLSLSCLSSENVQSQRFVKRLSEFTIHWLLVMLCTVIWYLEWDLFHLQAFLMRCIMSEIMVLLQMNFFFSV